MTPDSSRMGHKVLTVPTNTSRYWLLRIRPQVAVTCAFILRLTVSFFTGHPYDFEIWKTINSWLYVLGFNPLVWWTQGPLGLLTIVWPYSVYESLRLLGIQSIYLQHFVLHLLMISGDALMFVALYRLAFHVTGDRYTACATGFAWLLNPFTFWVSAVHGHFDQAMMALAILGLDFLICGKNFRAALFIAASIAVKYVMILLLPGIAAYMLLRRRKSMAFVSGYIVGMLVFFAPFLSVFLPLSPSGGLQLIKDRLWWTGLVNSERVVVVEGDLYRASVWTPYSALVYAGLADLMPTDWLIRLPSVLLGITSLLTMFVLSWRLWRAWREREAVSPPDALEKANVVTLVLTSAAVGYSSVNVTQRLSYVLAFLVIDAWIFQRTRKSIIIILSCLVFLPDFFDSSPFWYILAVKKNLALSLVGWWNTLPIKSRMLAISAGYVYSTLLIFLSWSGLVRLMGWSPRPVPRHMLWVLWSLYATIACSGVLFAWPRAGIFALACIGLLIAEHLVWSNRRVTCTANLLLHSVVFQFLFTYSILVEGSVMFYSIVKVACLIGMTIIWLILVQLVVVQRDQEQPMECRLEYGPITSTRDRICCPGSQA